MSVDLLRTRGDFYERKGINECGLGDKFPQYAEFWAKYVFPYRDPHDSLKLRRDYPTTLEDICNNHYSVFYHLTFAFTQLNYLIQTSFDQSILDIGNPLYHLATAIDLTERTFLLAFRASGEIQVKRLPFEDAIMKLDEFWAKYDEKFEEFDRRYVTVTLGLHDKTALFKQCLPLSKSRNEYLSISGQIRDYRNIFSHSLSPIRPMQGEIVYLPKRQDILHRYAAGRWSSEREINPDDYAPALEIIQQLADKLAVRTNNLWSFLLAEMETEKIVSLYSSMPYIDTTQLTPPSPSSEYVSPGTLTYQVPPEQTPSGDTKGTATIYWPGRDSTGASGYIVPTEDDPLS